MSMNDMNVDEEIESLQNLDIDKKKFDLNDYISRYKGPAKFQRLQFIANTDASLKRRACEMAIHDLQKETYDIATYRQMCKLINIDIDEQWISNTTRLFKDKQQHLLGTLNLAQRESRSELIRNALNDLAKLEIKRGEYNQAINRYLEVRENAPNPYETTEVNLNTTRVCIWSNNIELLRVYEPLRSHLKNEYQKSLLSISQGLSALKQGKYATAAQCFLSVHPDFISKPNDILSGEDIALYAVLCSFASLKRAEIRRRIIKNDKFHKFLELLPQLLNTVKAFLDCRYADVFQKLNEMKYLWHLDVFMSSHYQTLFKQISDLSYVEYFKPFVSVTISRMSNVFGTDMKTLEDNLVSLIQQGKIDARIDSKNKIVYARHVDERLRVVSDSLNMTNNFIQNAKNVLIGMSVVQNNQVLTKDIHTREADFNNPYKL